MKTPIKIDEIRTITFKNGKKIVFRRIKNKIEYWDNKNWVVL